MKVIKVDGKAHVIKRRKACYMQALRGMKVTNTRSERYAYPETKGTGTPQGVSPEKES